MSRLVSAGVARRIGFVAGYVAWLAACPIWAATPAAAPAQLPSVPFAIAANHIPLMPGLTIVTAVADKNGDFESIKTILSADAQAIELRYSSQGITRGDVLDDEPRVVKSEVLRRVRRVDLATAEIYMQQFARWLPKEVPGTTAIGVSRKVLESLRRTGKADITVFLPLVGGLGPPNPMDREPGDVDYRLIGTITRVEPETVLVRVLVNGVPVDLQAIHAKGTLGYSDVDFHFLNDADDPLTLRFDIEKESLRVIRIDFPGTLSPAAVQGGNAGAHALALPPEFDRIEQSLATQKRATVYGIYFDFGSATLRAESNAILARIAALLKKNPDWNLIVNGHTDNIGGDASNLALSRQRSAAVREALVSRYAIAPERLQAGGYGASQPQDTNTTLTGRARNRRVELIRE